MITVDIKKPMFQSYVAIYDKHLKRAIKLRTQIRLIVPQGVFIVDPRKWIDTGKEQKKVFLRPDEPMTLWENYATRFPTEETYKTNENLSRDDFSAVGVMSKLVGTSEWEKLRKVLHE